MENTKKNKYGKNRWIVLAFILLGIPAAMFYPPIRPHIQVAPEVLTGPLFNLPVIGDFYLTNTMVASLLAEIILLIIGFGVHRAVASGNLVLKGMPGAIEMIIEVLYNLTESNAGKWAKTIFPYFATIVLIVLLSNWMEIIPGVDSIGFVHHVEQKVGGTKVEGYPIQQLIPGVVAIVQGKVTEGEGYQIVPWVRVASTDLNFTVALALISVIMTQVVGVKAQGFRYFSKFFNTTTLFSKPFFGFMDLIVSVLELISELAKLLSFSFRLFGNIFAGSILLFLVGSMIPVFAQSVFLMFEFFIGAIQAIVFGMLTMIFMSSATKGHGGEHEEKEHA